MSFLIKSPDGEAITLNNLDKEAHEFWAIGREFSNKNYSSPVSLMNPLTIRDKLDYQAKVMAYNWFDTIGRAIHESKSNEWEKVEEVLLAPWLKKYEPDEIMESPEFEDTIRALLRLINHWREKGYKPQYVED